MPLHLRLPPHPHGLHLPHGLPLHDLRLPHGSAEQMQSHRLMLNSSFEVDSQKSCQSVMRHTDCMEIKSTSYLNNLISIVLLLKSLSASINVKHQHAGQEPLHLPLCDDNCVIFRVRCADDNPAIGNCHSGWRTAPSSNSHRATRMVSLAQITRRKPNILDCMGL